MVSNKKWICKYEFKYYNDAIDRASLCGHISVLEWFHNSDYEFKNTNTAIEAIELASQNGHITVLEWFYKNGFKKNWLKYCLISPIIYIINNKLLCLSLILKILTCIY